MTVLHVTSPNRKKKVPYKWIIIRLQTIIFLHGTFAIYVTSHPPHSELVKQSCCLWSAPPMSSAWVPNPQANVGVKRLVMVSYCMSQTMTTHPHHELQLIARRITTRGRHVFNVFVACGAFLVVWRVLGIIFMPVGHGMLLARKFPAAHGCPGGWQS